MIKRLLAISFWAPLAVFAPLTAQAGQQRGEELGGRSIEMHAETTDVGFALCVSIRNIGERSVFITAGIETQILVSFSPALPMNQAGMGVHESTIFGPPSWEDRSYILLSRNSSIEHCIDYDWELIAAPDQGSFYEVQSYFSSWLDRDDRLSPYVLLMTEQNDAVEPPLYRDEEIRSNVCTIYWQDRRVDC